MRRLMAACVVVLVAGVVVSLAAGGASSSDGRWVPKRLGGDAAFAINGRGQIVGSSENYAVWWVKGRLRDLGTLRGTEGGRDYACGINDRREIVGSALARPRSETIHAFLWVSGRMRDLGAPSVLYSEACGINMRGEVVGMSCRRGFFVGRVCRAFVWSNGVMRDLGSLGGLESEAVAINERGQIVGWADTDERSDHAFLWESGRMRDLGTLGGKESAAIDINDRGQIVGWAQTHDGRKHAVLWENGRVRDLGTRLDPEALNNRGQIVGACDSKQRSGDGTSRTLSSACVWTDGRIVNLGTVGYDAAVATDINDRGQIVGFVTDTCSGGCREMDHAYVWTPKQG